MNEGRSAVRSSAQTWEGVKVYYKSSPPGFTLRENELKVEDAYDHVLLGELKVFGSYTSIPASARPTQAGVLKRLRQKAFEVGANAVVYAYSNVSQAGSYFPPSGIAGGGWAVVIKTSTTETISRTP